MGYRSAVLDFTSMQPWKDFILICDEATAFKTPTTQVHQVVRHMSGAADRTWGLTATLIKNHLMEGYGIYQVIVPGLFGMNKNQFMLYYCLCRMQSIPRSNRQIPVIVGYLPERIQEFKDMIDPYFIGRAKHDVASDLPALIMQEIEVDLTDLQEEKYAEALAGLLEVGGTPTTTAAVVTTPDGSDREVAASHTLKEVTKLTAIIYCQQIINSPELIGIDGESPKLEALIDFLTEGDFAEEKVIVFSRFKKMIDIIMPRLAKEKIKAVRITGDETTPQRDAAMTAFQNPDSDVRVACITTAGSEAINLQAAKAFVCFETPWSAGEFLQLIGRMIRIGSAHDTCSVVHLVAKGRKKKTVDHRVLEVLGKKMHLVEAILGKRLKGTGDSSVISVENEISDLFQSLKQDAKEQK
jgi:SWI/SNF-related matrix-associated actin-dependent regulator 1 of chromatin subfamily A